MRIYIASGLGNIVNAKALADKLESLGHVITYRWMDHGPMWMHGAQRMTETATAELEGVRTADMMIVLLPGGRGTHFEMGAAVAFGVEVVVVGDARKIGYRTDGDTNYEPVDGTCAFYWLKSVLFCLNTENLIEYILTFPAKSA